MAASHQSPLMRDQWRAGDDYSDVSYPKERGRRDRWQRSPAASDRHREADTGLKIRGIAKPEKGGQPARKGEGKGEDEKLGRNRKDSQSPQRRDGVGSLAKHPRRPSVERRTDQHHYRHRDESSTRRRRSRSRSPAGLSRYKDERRRTRSPVYTGRTDRGVSTRHRERAYSPPRSPRVDHYSSARDDPSASRELDSYIPYPRRRRSRTPIRDEYRPVPNRRRSPSPVGRFKHRERSPVSRRERFSDWDSRREREVESTYRPPRSRQPSETRPEDPRSQRQSGPLHIQEEPRPAGKRQKRSRSPYDRERDLTEGRRMQPSGRPIQSILDESRPPSPPRRIPSFDADYHGAAQGANSYSMHDTSRRPPHVDTRHGYTPSPQWTPVASHHGSPQSASPYGQTRGVWGGNTPQYQGQPGINAYSPPYRQNSYPPQQSPQGQYYPNHQQSPYHGPPQQAHGGYQEPPYNGGHQSYRGGHAQQPQDRRYSGGSHPPYGGSGHRGRGHFQNLQWTASGGSRGGRQAQSAATTQEQPPATLPDEDDNPFRPSKDLQVEDQSNKKNEKKMPPPVGSKESSKFSFAFKSKAAPTVAAKPVPDLAQKMKEPPRKENLLEGSRSKGPPPSREPPSARSGNDHRDNLHDRREDRRERDYRDDPRPRDRYDDRYDDRGYYDGRHRDERKTDREPERKPRRQRSPEIIIEKKIMRRQKPRPKLPNDFAESKSVYFRKPGNESVVGSGTYGKVFKAIHVYTRHMVALKKIRMEGEKDGFPVTAVREIKLLQSLKHDNVVSLQEVMVEANDCFMVFEYLSHDLTGLLNHPTFKLEHAHKKHLAKQLFDGLNYLHRRGVLHRDIKAANILVSNTGQLKLADFGLARFFSKRGKPDYTNRVITIWYRSPELLLGETQYGPAVDIWSAACVMVEIFTRHAIFPGDGGEINQLEKIYNVLGTPTRSEWPQLVEMAWFELLRPAERKTNTFAEKYQERLTPAAFELLQAMLLYDPAKRPTAGDVLEHPYFTTEEPSPRQVTELKDLQGDWHEFESKALRKENERKAQDARRAARSEEHQKEKEKRRTSGSATAEREAKRPRPNSSQGPEEAK